MASAYRLGLVERPSPLARRASEHDIRFLQLYLQILLHMCKERKQVFRVCYLVRARAMAQMTRVNFVRVTVIICLHSNLKIHDNCPVMHSGL